jgi:ADP-heptose:LPS heptosyltransferase
VNKKVPKILIIRCGLLGDTVDSTAIIKPLLAHYGNEVVIDWVTKSHLKNIFKYDERINPLKVKYTNLPLFLNYSKLMILLKSYLIPYDVVINLEVGTKFDSLVKFLRANVKIGKPINNIDVQYKDEHRVKHQLRIIKSFYKSLECDKAFPYLKGSNIDIAKQFGIKNNYIVICPTNSKFKKKNYRGYRAWPVSNWISLIKKIIQKTELDIVITGIENERDFIKQINLDSKRIHHLCGRTDIPDMFEVMKKSECVIANDSGSVHVAGVSCKKVISLHGPTPFSETGPYGNSRNKIIEANINLNCSPCYNTDAIKKCKSNRCMIELSPEKVFEYI